MTSRRTVLGVGATALLGAPALVGFAEQVVTLKFHTFMSPSSDVWRTMHLPWMERITKESGGRIKFEPYPAMQLGGTPAQLYDQARDGVADIVWTLPGYTAGRFQKSEVFELPFMMNNAQATSLAYWEYLNTVAQDEFKDTHLLAVNVHGPGTIHTRSKAVKSVADLKGMKIRGPSRQITKMLSYLGAIPVGMPLPAIPDALSKGAIDGCVLPWEVIPSIKVQELTRFHSEFDPLGGALYTATFVMTMNNKRYMSLEPDLRKIIDKHSGMATSGLFGKTQQGNDPHGKQAALEHGNQVTVITTTDAQEFRRKAALVEVEWIADMNQKGLDGNLLRNTARALIAKHGRNNPTTVSK